jgi:hypothetical protein
VEYPELNWFQPTFPAADNRFELEKDKTLTLRFRIWIHKDKAGEAEHSVKWLEYNK